MPTFRVTKQEIWRQSVLIEANDEDEAVEKVEAGEGTEAILSFDEQYDESGDWRVDDVTGRLPRFIEGEVVIPVCWRRGRAQAGDIENVLGRSSLRTVLADIELTLDKAKAEFSPLRVQTNIKRR